MGDVYWMTGLLMIQAIVSTIICIVISKNTESIIGESEESEVE